MLDRIKKHEKILKIFFYIALAIILFYIVKNELSEINWGLFKQAISSKSWLIRILLVITGLLGFSVNGFYDVVATRGYPIHARTLSILKIGWISQAFNEFIDIGGLTGGTLRLNAYHKRGLSNKQALQLSVMNWFASFLGLVFLTMLAIPLAYRIGVGSEVAFMGLFILYLPLFLFAEKIPFIRKKLEAHGLNEIPWWKKGAYVLVSICDWSAALSYFLLVMHLFNPHFNLADGVVVYVFAIIIGIFSFIPGGVGAFDVTVLLGLGTLGYENAQVLAALVVLRVCYYLIPWLLASGYVTLNWFSKKTTQFHQSYLSIIIINILTVILFLVGALMLALVLAPQWFEHIHFLRHFVPLMIMKLSAFITLVVGIIMILLSIGIHDQVKRVYQISFILLPFAALLCLGHGFSYKEALMIMAVWLLLFACRKQFFRNSVPLTSRNVITAAVISLGLLLITSYAVAMKLAEKEGEIIISISLFNLIVILLLIIGIGLLFLFIQSSHLPFTKPTEEEINRFTQLVKTYGGSEYSYLVYMEDKQIFFYQEDGQDLSALLYRVIGRNALVLGNPVGLDTAINGIITAFAEFAHQYGMNVCYYQVSPDYLNDFCNMGYLTIKIGESARVKLADFTFDGKANRNFRKIRNAKEAAGLAFEILEAPHPKERLDELREISNEWLGKRHEMSYSLGAFKEDYLQHAPIAVLRSKDRIEAFANLMYIDEHMISIDMMRHRKDCPGNAMQMVFLELFEWAKNKGYDYFDLGMAPLTNIGNQTYSRSRDRLIRLVYEYGNRIYGFKGLRAYKEKYRPEWENRYIIYAEAAALPQILLALLEAANKPPKEKKNRKRKK